MCSNCYHLGIHCPHFRALQPREPFTLTFYSSPPETIHLAPNQAVFLMVDDETRAFCASLRVGDAPAPFRGHYKPYAGDAFAMVCGAQLVDGATLYALACARWKEDGGDVLTASNCHEATTGRAYSLEICAGFIE